MPRILLIEDDIDVCPVFEHILLSEGYQVDSAQTMVAGRELLRHRVYDLVVADGRLPDGTGMEIADQAREKGIPSVIVTGYAFILRELAQNPDRYTVLLKPMRSVELLEAVTRALEDRQYDAT
jgi:DNA-binding NtrC family response regulator